MQQLREARVSVMRHSYLLYRARARWRRNRDDIQAFILLMCLLALCLIVGVTVGDALH